jgi:hypothetical protein
MRDAIGITDIGLVFIIGATRFGVPTKALGRS